MIETLWFFLFVIVVLALIVYLQKTAPNLTKPNHSEYGYCGCKHEGPLITEMDNPTFGPPRKFSYRKCIKCGEKFN